MPPGDMPKRIRQFCINTNQCVPESKGEIIRCILQSLSLKYRMTLESLEEITGKKYASIHMVGGGIKDEMLCQFTAEATGRTVLAGPVEATAIGNLMMQIMAIGEVKTLKEIRKIVKNSFPITKYIPHEIDLWDKAYVIFKNVLSLN